MRNISNLCVVFGIVALLAVSTAAEATVFSIKAVGRQECIGQLPATSCVSHRDCDPGFFCGVVDIEPTNKLSVSSGDVSVVEVFVSDWSPAGEAAWSCQIGIDRFSFFNKCPGGAPPIRWDRKLECGLSCFTDGDCPNPEWPCCIEHQCYGCDHDPVAGAFIDDTRSDWVFAGAGGTVLVAVEKCAYLFGAAVGGIGAVNYGPPPKYAASLILEILPGSLGTFTIDFDEDRTFVRDESGQDLVPFILEPLVLDAGCCCDVFCQVESTSPPNCSIDARQTSEPDGSNPAGWDSMTFNSGKNCEPTMGDFTITQIPDGAPPNITGVTEIYAQTWRVDFDRTITPGRWTCVELNGVNEFCIGSLPADVDADLICTDTGDIQAIMDHLDNVTTYPEWRCDTDRSGRCSPADILRVIDHLNGGGVYDTWLGRSIQPCPTRSGAPPGT